MKIVALDALTLGDVRWKKLEKLGEVKIYDTTRNEEIINRIKDANIVITNKVVINKQIIDAAKNLKMIQIAATGMDNVDVGYAKSKNIIVKNIVGYSTDSVVQLTFTLVLGLICKIRYFDEYSRKKYANSEIFTHISNWFEISGKVWGIIGLGNIGKKVARLAQCFGAEVIYHSTSGKNFNKNFKRVKLDELLKISNIITIHAPLNNSTKNLLNYEKLKFIQDGAVLVNVGRGGIINERDLAKILENKDLKVGIDVYETEPINENNELLNFKDKTLLTPHIARTSIESRERLMNGIYENIFEFLKS
jgi:glycerate dehydrogenase